MCSSVGLRPAASLFPAEYADSSEESCSTELLYDAEVDIVLPTVAGNLPWVAILGGALEQVNHEVLETPTSQGAQALRTAAPLERTYSAPSPAIMQTARKRLNRISALRSLWTEGLYLNNRNESR